MLRYPTSVRAVIPAGESAGKLVICGLPGLEIARDGAGYMDPYSCETTFSELHNYHADLFYLLVEENELPDQAMEVLTEQALRFRCALICIEIPDFGTPDQAAYNLWRHSQEMRRQTLDAGRAICLSCLYGAGRSGMMAAKVIAEIGTPVNTAIAHVRQAYSEAISNDAQLSWLVAQSEPE